MRLFVAIDIPDAVKADISRYAQLLKSDAAVVAIAREQHITLKFLGDCPESIIPELERKLSHISFSTFDAKTAKIGTFGEGHDVKVVWCGIDPVEPFAKLAKQIDQLLPEFKNDHAEYMPHITFARVKRVIALAAFYDLLEKAQLPERHFRVSSIKLYKSEGTDDGHKYTVLATFPSKAL